MPQRGTPRGLSHAAYDTDRDVSTSALSLPCATSLRLTLAGKQRHRVREELVPRIRAEFEEMPGLSLTSAQASKFFGMSPEVCADILANLIEEGMLSLNSDQRYSHRLAPA